MCHLHKYCHFWSGKDLRTQTGTLSNTLVKQFGLWILNRGYERSVTVFKPSLLPILRCLSFLRSWSRRWWRTGRTSLWEKDSCCVWPELCWGSARWDQQTDRDPSLCPFFPLTGSGLGADSGWGNSSDGCRDGRPDPGDHQELVSGLHHPDHRSSPPHGPVIRPHHGAEPGTGNNQSENSSKQTIATRDLLWWFEGCSVKWFKQPWWKPAALYFIPV